MISTSLGTWSLQEIGSMRPICPHALVAPARRCDPQRNDCVLPSAAAAAAAATTANEVDHDDDDDDECDVPSVV